MSYKKIIFPEKGEGEGKGQGLSHFGSRPLYIRFPFRLLRKSYLRVKYPITQMTSQLVANHREGAEIYHGDSLCKQKSIELLKEIRLPNGLLPLDDIVEVGYNRTTGFVWVKQKNRKEHKFRAIGRNVSYDTEVTAFVEDRKMRRLTGVKSKEFLIWVTISDIYVDSGDTGKITFGNPTGISRNFPVSAFELEEEKKWLLFRLGTYVGFE